MTSVEQRRRLPEEAAPAYSYAASLKSGHSDELINLLLMRPAAGVVVRILFPTRVTPNQVTVASTVAGIVAAAFYLGGTHVLVALGGCFVTLKDLLDSADGQLARAKKMYSRRGRFLDSIGDFIVNVALFGAIGWVTARGALGAWGWLLAAAGLIGILLRVSYHVFYHTSYLHIAGTYGTNRTTEEIRGEDLGGDPVALRLQRVFQFLYGWQDALMARIDRWCAGGEIKDPDLRMRWFGDPLGLRLSGVIGIATELFVLMLFSLGGALEAYLWWNLTVMNGAWGGAIAYRRWVLRGKAAGAAGVSSR
jgi:phosphatidylglycerophosphate synthase